MHLNYIKYFIAIFKCPLVYEFDASTCESITRNYDISLYNKTQDVNCYNWYCSLRLNCECFTGKVSNCNPVQDEIYPRQKPGCIYIYNQLMEYDCDIMQLRDDSGVSFDTTIKDFECAIDACLDKCSIANILIRSKSMILIIIFSSWLLLI